jgi:hypothetical protein
VNQVANLNTGQQKAADDFSAFMFSDQKEFVITGGPGTGKTHLLKHLVGVATQQYRDTCAMLGIKPEYEAIQLTATTNTASEVLENLTGWPTMTIHSFMNLKVTGDATTGKTSLTRTRNWKIHERYIIFVDESSLVDRALYDFIHEGTHKCKIVWIGDKDQLMSPTDGVSPVFVRSIPSAELTEPMRNSSQPDLINIVAQLRETVRTGIFYPIQAKKGVIDWVNNEGLEQALITYHKAQSYDHRIMAYTNNRVILYNDHIRDMRGLTDPYHVGEILVAVNSTQRTEFKISIEQKFTVTAVGGIEEVDFGDDIKFLVQTLNLAGKNGAHYRDVRVPAEPEHYRQLIRWLKDQKKWPLYFSLQETFLELRPHDAATVYKGQGNSHDVVIIDLSNISTCHNADQVARMLYVAFSRARNRVIMYGDLPKKYGSVLAAE